MKYKLIPSEERNNSNTLFIYVLPTSFEGSSFSIAYPECKVEDILAGRLSIRKFDGCSIEAILEINTELKERLKVKHLKYAERINTLFTAGIGILVLGIVNWVIPDPLPLVDELLFSIIGGITAWKAWKDRKVKLPLLAEQTYRYGYDNFKPDVESDIILTTIFKSIRCKIDPKKAGDVSKDMDKIEIESLWISKYLNIQDQISSGDFELSKLKYLISIITKIFPIRKIVKLQSKKQKKSRRDYLVNLLEDTLVETGISSKVMEVYIEFYREYLSYSAEG
jgi:hypothetical protein